MKRILLTTLALCLFVSVEAQNLTIDELTSFVTKDVSDVNDYLISKDWGLTKLTDTTDTKQFKWVYGLEKFRNTVKGYIVVGYKNEANKTVTYLFFDKKLYTDLHDAIIKSGGKKVKSNTDDGIISAFYEIGKYIYFLSTSPDGFTVSTYLKKEG